MPESIFTFLKFIFTLEYEGDNEYYVHSHPLFSCTKHLLKVMNLRFYFVTIFQNSFLSFIKKRRKYD